MISGTGVAQLLPMISAPIVARLYEPEHFGTYAIFYSLVTILSGVAFLDYHNAVLIEKSNRKAYYALIISFLCCIGVSILSLFLVLIIPHRLLSILLGAEVLPYLWVLPLTVFISSVSTLFYTWFLRKKEFSLISKNKVIIALLAVFIQIGMGFLRIGAMGFIIANLISFAVSAVLFGFTFYKTLEFSLTKIKTSFLIEIVKKYKNFPLVSVWANSLNIVTLQLPQFLLNSFFGSYVVGQFSLANRMINLPISFISSSIQDLFRQNAAAENAEAGNCKNSYKRFLKIGFIVGGVSFLACITFIPPIFVFVFGDKWAAAGVYVRVLALLTAVRFVIAPLSYVFYIKLKQKLDMLWQVGLFILTLISLYGGFFWFGITNAVDLLFGYSVILSLWYILNGLISFKLANMNDK